MKNEKTKNKNREEFGKIGRGIFLGLYDMLEETKEYCKKERAKLNKELKRK